MSRRLRIEWPDVPRIDDAIYPDAYIEHWADRYVDGGYLYRGVTLMQFLARPHIYESRDRSANPLPLLGAQMRVQTQLIMAERRARRTSQGFRDGEPLDIAAITRDAERGLEQCPRRNGAYIEPLHHHAHPYSVADFAAMCRRRRR